MKSVARCCIVTSLVGVLVLQDVLVAGVRDAASKARGDYATFRRSSSRNMRNSRNVSRDIRRYARTSQRSNQLMAPDITRSLAGELGQSIKQTQTYLVGERKIATAENDKEILAKLDKIDKLVAQEADAQAKLIKACSGNKVDSAATVECCEQCEDAIDKAIEIHDEIEELLEDDK